MNRYSDIINLPHHVSEHRRHMSMTERAAQFSPFSALSGYGAAISETARLTTQKIELSESQQQALGEKLATLKGEIELTYFIPDLRKSGGEYVKERHTVKRVDGYNQKLILEEGVAVPFEDIYDISEVTGYE